MEISRGHAQRLIRLGKAKEEGLVKDEDHGHTGCYWVSITRFDKQRTDHYWAIDADIRRLKTEGEE